MKIKLTVDETLSTGFAAAGTVIPITGTNADEAFALALMSKAVLLDESAVAATPGDVGPAYASFLARRPIAGVTLSSAAPPANAPAGAILSRLTLTNGGAVTLIDDAGGRLALQGRNLVATSVPFVAGQPVRATIAVDGVPRNITFYPAALSTAGAPPGPVPTIAFAVPNVSIPEGNSGTTTVSNTINATRNGVTGALLVNLAYSGSATAGVDYLTPPASVTIPSGSSTVSFDLTVNSDTTLEADEAIVIGATLAAYPSSSASKTITIANDDYATNPGSPSGDRTVSLTARALLPDGAYPASAGKGFPCTGLDMAADGTFWAGQGTAGSTSTAGLVRLSSTFSAILSQLTIGAMGLPNGSVQGVTIDDSDGSLFFILVDTINTLTYLVHCSTAGALISSTQIGSTMNGIAYDNQRDALIVLYDSGTVKWQNKAAPHADLAGKSSFSAAGSENDQLFYDPTRRELLVSGGGNGVNGTVDVYNVTASGAPTFLSTITLDQALAIEGVVRRGDDIIVLSDQSTHPASGNAYNFNQVDSFANAFAPGTPAFSFAGNVSAAEGGGAVFTLNANRNGTSGDLTGTYGVGGGTADAADFGGAFPAGSWTIPNGSNSTTITVTSSQDTGQESDETYVLTASYGGSPVATANGTIVDDDAPAGSYTAEATALFARMSVQPTSGRKTTVDNLIKALKTAGVWTKLDGFYVMAAHAQQAALLNWTGAKADATLVGATPPSFTADRGFTTDGAANYIDYGWAPSGGTKYLQNDASIGVWINNNSAMSNGSGCLSTLGANSVALNPRASSGASAYRVNCTTAGSGAAGQTDSRGMSSASRTASNAQQMYRSGAAFGSASTSASTAPLASNFVSGATTGPAYQAQQFALGLMGGGLSATEHAAVYSAVNDYMTAVGNQVV